MNKKLPENKLRTNTSSLVRIGNKYLKMAAKQKGKDYNSIGGFIESAILEKLTPLTWIEEERPKDGQSIIFEDAVGMFKGTYSTNKSGQVDVNGQGDIISWEDIYCWIPYPKSQY